MSKHRKSYSTRFHASLTIATFCVTYQFWCHYQHPLLLALLQIPFYLQGMSRGMKRPCWWILVRMNSTVFMEMKVCIMLCILLFSIVWILIPMVNSLDCLAKLKGTCHYLLCYMMLLIQLTLDQRGSATAVLVVLKILIQGYLLLKYQRKGHKIPWFMVIVCDMSTYFKLLNNTQPRI